MLIVCQLAARRFVTSQAFSHHLPSSSTYSVQNGAIIHHHHRRSLTGYRKPANVSQEVKIKELISSLNSEERHALYTQLRLALLKEQWNKQTQHAPNIPPPPRNAFFAWLRRGRAYMKNYIEKPTRSQLMNLFMYHSLPYVAFGFMDNCIMIVAGEYIEAYLGASIGLSTMGAAGLGNTLADAISIALAYQVERFFTSMMQGPASITLSQFELARTRLVIQLARIIGIMIGCLLGMTPLLFK